jgi:hypothetical protein
MAEISILLKKGTTFAYGECRKNFNDSSFSRGPLSKMYAVQNVRLRESSTYLKTQEAYVN